MANINELLGQLNPAQFKAVQHPPQVPLQILAGPGSGKTKVLTMRIAYLITYCYLPPSSICAVTFTNKAANEMRERLYKLLGKDRTSRIKMGTFHALCAIFLRRYSKTVGLDGNFTVCDADESKKMIAKLLKPYKELLTEKNMTLTENGALGFISKVKAKGWTADDARRYVEEMNALTPQERFVRTMGKFEPWEGEFGLILASVYKDYEKSLREANSLDFDDLLMFGVKLFAKHAKASSWCRHVLVDEFQDTNSMQYDLMVYIARASQCVTIVGDPDQSIYGWRSAEIANLGKMQQDFPATQQIYLEQNYRSTGSILALSLAIVSQDKGRIQKTLRASHAQGPPPVLRVFPIEQVEAAFIAAEIKRLVAFSGGMLNWGDFVVLLRFNSLSRAIESALQKESIPNRVLAGHKFFERMEIKDVLAYLQLVDNPQYVPAFLRVVNVPSRAVGVKTINEITLRAQQLKISPLKVVERIVDGKIPDTKPPVKKKLAPFVHTIRILRRHANGGIAPSKLINALVDSINYKEHLIKTQPDADSRWDNVQELVNFASEVEHNGPEDLVRRMFEADEALHEDVPEDRDGEESQDDWEDGMHDFDGDQAEGLRASGDTPLRLFLQASMLSSDTETPEEEKSKEKVTISTCHAAKGLEWPVVMIPAVQSGVFPSTRAEDVDEERRLLYVACTRAKGLLYLTHTTARMMSGEFVPTHMSDFIGSLRDKKETRDLFTETLPSLPQPDRTTIATVTGRSLPDEAEVARRVSEYAKTARHPAWGDNAPFRETTMHTMDEDVVAKWTPQSFPSVPLKTSDERNPAGGPGYRQDTVQPVSGPAAFSSSSSLLTTTQRAGVVRTADVAPVIPIVHRTPSSAPQQPTAGPSSSRYAVDKFTSRASGAPRSMQETRAKPTPQAQSRSQNMPSLRQSSVGLTKEEPIDIDALPLVSVPTRMKPLASKPVTVVSERPSASSRVVSSTPTRFAPTQAMQRSLQLPPAPALPPSLSYRTPPSSAASLPSSTSGSRSPLQVVAAPPVAPVVQPTGGKRRLGMGRTVTGYANKKFKPVTPGS